MSTSPALQAPVRQLRLESALDQLNQIAFRKPREYQWWLTLDDADQGICYCYDCAMKRAGGEGRSGIDGGRPQDSDTPVYCEDCQRPLQYTLTEFGVIEELDHFKGKRLLRPVTPEAAFELARVLEHHRGERRAYELLPKVERALKATH